MNVGIRSARYKYLSFPQDDYEMLFDLYLDSQENINLAYEDNYERSHLLISLLGVRVVVNVESDRHIRLSLKKL